MCIKIDFYPSVKVTPCISVYHSWPNSYVEIFAYYQFRKLKLKWPVSQFVSRVRLSLWQDASCDRAADIAYVGSVICNIENQFTYIFEVNKGFKSMKSSLFAIEMT